MKIMSNCMEHDWNLVIVLKSSRFSFCHTLYFAENLTMHFIFGINFVIDLSRRTRIIEPLILTRSFERPHCNQFVIYANATHFNASPLSSSLLLHTATDSNLYFV